MSKSKLLCFFLALFLIIDFSYSFLEYYHTPLDGDIAGGVVPAEHVQPIFDDPFGVQAILEDKPHSNPNRYFAHLFFRDYFQTIPFVFQKIVAPIESVYFSNALIKTLTHLLMVYLLASLISQTKSIFNKRWLLAAILITPLFQAYGYHDYMGLIDKAVTYFFFYAFPLMLLLLFYWYFYDTIYHNRETNTNIIEKILLIALTVILPFSGPLIPGIILIVSLLTFIHYFLKNKMSYNVSLITNLLSHVPKKVALFFVPISLLSLYSLWLGSYNADYQEGILTISERYARLPTGVYYQFTQKIGFPILFLLLLINIGLIKKHFYSEEGAKIITSLKWVGIFTVIYILLLPLGGYRPYRPNILRFDTIAPITLCLVYIYGISTYFILQNIKKYKQPYIILTIVFLGIFINSDISYLNESDCEKQALMTISTSEDAVVGIETNCDVLSWGIITDSNESSLNAALLYFWNITDKEKLYFHENN